MCGRVPSPLCGRWAAGLDDLLQTAEVDRRTLLVQLIHADIEFRWHDGQTATVEEYIARYPELRADTDVLLGLIVRECEHSRVVTGYANAQDYVDRFPELRSELLLRLRSEFGADVRRPMRDPNGP